MRIINRFVAIAVAGVSAAAIALAAGQTTAPGVPASIVVTLEPKHGKEIPQVEQQDITVREGKDKRPVSAFTSLANADTQLMLLIDDSARGTFDTEIQTLRQFISSLPPSYDVAVGYMRNGMADLTQNFTRDHAAAANGVRIALGPGGADVSPYDSLTDAIRKWPNTTAQRKEVLMISSGIEALGGGLYPENPYVTAGIESAVKAGIVVYSIYSPSVGHAGHSLWQSTWGQNFLSELSDQTGGESYWIGYGSPVSFQPFLDQFLEAQRHQYLLTFIARPEKKSGMQQIRVSIEEKDASIAAPSRVYVKASL
ncbi:MAG: hypothetical protein JO210_01700 [Acidobacteriaceae bacterium]|nr:hypothetical protein [Acidobacteriaceae bacterium]